MKTRTISASDDLLFERTVRDLIVISSAIVSTDGATPSPMSQMELLFSAGPPNEFPIRVHLVRSFRMRR